MLDHLSRDRHYFTVRFVLDTNIVIPAEPTSAADIEEGTSVIANLLGGLGEGGHSYLVHPGIREDISRDSDEARKILRTQLLAKYPVLQHPPPLSRRIIDELGQPSPGSNDDVDFRMLAALEADCADYVVTNDARMRKRAARIGLGGRVLSASDALATIRALFPTIPLPPPLVRAVRAHCLNDSDRIFESLRSEYDGFLDWLRKCKREQRHAWVIERDGCYAGLCILNEEQKPEYQLVGRVLKLCTFKISDSHRGFRYGELLLKALFHYLTKNRFDFAFVEVFPRHEELCSLLAEFGFVQKGETHRGEFVLAKTLRPDQSSESLPPLEYHVAFGPYHLKVNGIPGYVVPIQPRYHAMLFPEGEAQLSLVAASNTFGNSIRKAYLCNSRLRDLRPGSFLLFYRSQDLKAVTCLGVVEESMISNQATEIARFVGRRTVYTFEEIENMAAKPVLAILFRQARLLDSPWGLEQIKRSGVVNGPPQSIASVPPSAQQWLIQQLHA